MAEVKNTKRHLAELNTRAQSLAIIVAVRVYNGHLILIVFLKVAQARGRTGDFCLFSLSIAAT